MCDIIIYIAGWWEKYLSKRSLINHTCSSRDKRIVLNAILVAKGYEKPQKNNSLKDFPIRGKETTWTILRLISNNNWSLNVISIKTGFVLGEEIDSDILVKVPREINKENIWLLKKYIYWLLDASTEWCNRVKSK